MSRNGKFITRNQVTGQKGINLIERIVLEMGYSWNPTSGAMDAGVDGVIEIRDPSTGEASSLILQVQSKATEGEFESETPASFVYRVKERDLNYWLQGNAPVLLVVSRPATNEGYWISVKDYFNTPERRAARKVEFDRNKNRFDKAAGAAIASLAMPTDKGIYLHPPPKDETLSTNLLEVAHYAAKLFVAQTAHSTTEKVEQVFHELEERPGRLWFVKEGKIYSFHDLNEYPWTKVCDAGSVEPFNTSEWANSTDHDRRSEFVRLLNLALRTLASRKDIGAFVQPKRPNVYYFRPRVYRNRETDVDELVERDETWKLQKQSTRRVVERYYTKSEPVRLMYYKHHAFTGRFRRFENRWFLEITPTYHYTGDGRKESRFREENLAGMKRQEGHGAIANNVRFLAYFLAHHDMFDREYPYLRFGRLLEFETDFGIPDTDWANRADPEEVAESVAPEEHPQLLLS
ncbi:MAG TPA: DUF4365 domain-containing protein [Verrucomicrobiota bacterium]|nr:DUF4365 domain-containing protein [Verrucomicrobiota bacterium]HPC51847.1 DUF4365 domain-containing protein [Verrucomicrobiota bacterium]HPL35722.1 DUF4365 domain-containing protein [Verrucomicrobiota bacterium]HRV39072.1 DUF4365 domain-containing protein [Candidatus Paceibacterota bacterium]